MVPINQISKSLVFFLAGVSLLQGGLAQAAVIIDDFSSSQQVKRGPNTATTGFNTFNELQDSSIIGGYRDLWLQAFERTSGTALAQGTVDPVNGILKLDNGSSVRSWLNVTWDGNDPGADSSTTTSIGTQANPNNPINNSPNTTYTFANNANDLRKVVRNGLGDRDLTEGGLWNSIALDFVTSIGDFIVEMTIYDTNGTGISTASYTFTDDIIEPTTLYFAFDNIAQSQLSPSAFLYSAVFTGNARFNHVGAINLTLKALQFNADADLAILQAANTAATVPEPSISFLAFSGVAAAGLLTRKKK